MNIKKNKKIFALFSLLFIFYAIISSTFSIYRETQNDSIDLSVLDPNGTTVVNFNPNGGTIPQQDASRSVPNGTEVGALPTTMTRANYNFDGWYTDPDPTEGVKITDQTIVTGTTVTYYAHWIKIVCKKATTRHTETCATGAACIQAGYAPNDIIYYGNIPGASSPKVGDAYDCDVNDDGVWNATTERFYYIKSYGTTDPIENSVLIHYTSFDENGQMDSSKTRGNYFYNEALSYLPTSSLWTNSALISENGNITRFLSRDDLEDACGSKTVTALASCEFVLENSRFQDDNLGRAGIWLLKEENTLYRIQTESYAIANVESDSKNTARPVIQIPSNTIEDYNLITTHAITFNPTQGSLDNPSDANRTVVDGNNIGTLPSATLAHYTLDGWYTAASGGTKISANTVPTGDITYYAQWIQNISITLNANSGTVSPSSIEMAPGTAIGTLPTPEYTNHHFLGWFTDNGTYQNEVTAQTVFNSSTEIYAKWEEDNPLDYVFYIPGECSFTSSGITDGANGDCISTINPTGSNIDYTQSQLSSKKYIDTGIALYNITNNAKNYEIGFTITSYTTTGQSKQATIMNSKLESESNYYPGVVFRRKDETEKFEISSRETTASNVTKTFTSASVDSVVIYRTDEKIYYKINGGSETYLNDITYNPIFDTTTWFGASPKDVSGTTAQRYFIGSLSNMYIKLESDNKATVTFDPNYQGASTFDQRYTIGQAMGTLPTEPTRPGYTFDGWYTAVSGGTEVDGNTVINNNITFYAHWIENITITFNPGQDATVSPNTRTFTPNTAIGELPTPQKTGYAFTGWYTEASGGTEVTAETVFSTSDTIYAHWVEYITVTFNPGQDATVSPSSKTFAPNTAIGELPTPQKTGYAFTGWYTAASGGTEVTTQTVFSTSDTIYAHWEEIEDITVTFDADGGTVSPSTKTFAPGTAIGELPTPDPTPNKTGNNFVGWYTDNTYTTEVTATTTFDSTTTIIAKWVDESYVACIGNTCYTTLSLAIGAVPTTGVKTTIKIIANITTTATTTIPSTKWVELDIGSHTISTTTSKVHLLTNEGKIDIINGNLYSTGGYIILNKAGATLNISGGTITYNGSDQSEYKPISIDGGTVNISGGTITGNSKAAAINVNNSNCILNVSGGRIYSTNTFKGQGIYNNGGTTTISGNARIENVSADNANGRAAVHNNAGTVNILGGTIISSGNAAVKNSGIMIIGTDDGTISTTSPYMQGHTYGLETVSGKNVTIYDGIFKGKVSTYNKAISNESYTNIGTYQFAHDTETIDNVQYAVAYLEEPPTCTITFNPGQDGTVSPATKTFTSGTAIGELPTPQKTGYTFDGWYTAASGGTEVTTQTTFSVNDTIYAHWIENITITFNAGQDGTVSPTSKTFASGTAIGELPTPQKTGYTFNGWYTAASGGTEVTTQTTFSVNDTIYAQWTENITITFNPGQDGTVSPTSKTFASGTAIGELPTPQKTGYTFDGWYTAASGGTEVTTQTTFSVNDTIYAHWVENITINFGVNGGTTIEYNSKTLASAGPIGTLPSASKTNTEFLGWFSAASGGERLLETTEITASDNGKTYYAHYTNATIVCRPATTLHSSGGTNFGQIHSGSALSAGDAYDCDVNGDGTYDATDERFYYLTNASNGNAVFIFGNNIHQGGNGATAMCKPDAITYGSNFANGPNTAITELPTTTDWPNVNLYTEPRTITNEAHSTVVNNYLYTGKAARLATLDEIKAATSSSINGTNNELASYTFLLENTASYGDCRSNYWLETPKENGGAYRIDGSSSKKLGNATGSSGVRPVIEVPYSSIDGIANIVEFDTIPAAMRNYFNNVATWNVGMSDSYTSDSINGFKAYNDTMDANLDNYNCIVYNGDNVNSIVKGTVQCDQPNKYDTGITGNINVYEYNESTGTISNTQATYVSNDNGKLYNFIPGKTYYWVSATDSTKNGYVRPTGERRLITIPGTNRQVRNVRDLGGLPVDTNGDGVIDGKTKFAKIYRGEKIWGTSHNGVTRGQFETLGIYNEFDLREQGTSEIVYSEEDQLTNYTPFEIIHYKINPTNSDYQPASEARFNGKSYYELSRDAAIDVMQKIVAGNADYAIFFHCRVGADRTGTLAYLLEGVLGVPTEYRHQDYELSTFFGLNARTRYYYKKDNNDKRFIYLKKAIRAATPNNDLITGEENVMDWFLYGGNTSDNCNDISGLINQFRTKMIDYNS